jgi:hypothetical protein
VLVSTQLDRNGEDVGTEVSLHGDEGLIIELQA